MREGADDEFRGWTWFERPDTHEVWTEQCRACRHWFPIELFPPNPRVSTGRSSWCRPCHVERNRKWREEHPEYIEQYNLARREGPFVKACMDCKKTFDAVRRIQIRCPDCQAVRRAKR